LTGRQADTKVEQLKGVDALNPGAAVPVAVAERCCVRAVSGVVLEETAHVGLRQSIRVAQLDDRIDAAAGVDREIRIGDDGRGLVGGRVAARAARTG
jgi:hypothetical protein